MAVGLRFYYSRSATTYHTEKENTLYSQVAALYRVQMEYKPRTCHGTSCNVGHFMEDLCKVGQIFQIVTLHKKRRARQDEPVLSV